MYLKSLEVYGFKSFADRTKIEFDKGITVIVGPNGCGKSNVVDSAKWVLGEKQAKNIRGDKMEDVIFTGTEHRKFLSIAQVALAIDNTTRFLKCDSDTVTVMRRVFRDGVSEYLINNSPVRLKDIEDIFLDTGIGKSSYSFMEQGRIDMILSSKAEDRRYIFEEAAGISRFKVQKKDSLKKLEDTKENLDRVSDILHEIEREKDTKARQAEKTKAYLTLKEEFKKNDVKINVLKLKSLYRKISKKKNKLSELIKNQDNISQRISSVSEENEKDEQFKNEIQTELWDLEKRIQAYQLKAEDIDGNLAKNNKLINDYSNRKNRLVDEISQRQNNLNNFREEKERNLKNGEEINRRIEEDRVKLYNFFELRKQKIADIHNCRDKIEQNKSSIKNNEEDLIRLRDELEVVIHQLIEAIEKRKEELVQSESERVVVRDSIYSRLKELESVIQEAKRNASASLMNETVESLNKISIDDLFNSIKKFESYEDGFRSILFDKTGIHAKKEALDNNIRDKSKIISNCRFENSELEERIRNLQNELEEVNNTITRIEKDLSRDDNEIKWIEKQKHTLDMQISELEKHLENIRNEISGYDNNILDLKNEIDEWKNKILEINERSIHIKQKIEENNLKKTEINTKIMSRKESSTKDIDELNNINGQISKNEKISIELNYRSSAIEEYLWNEHEIKKENIDKVKAEELQLSAISEDLQKVKQKIQELGPINNLAIEEYDELKKRFDYYIKQKKDIEKAREDIYSVIAEINKTSIDMFVSTFEQIKKNFTEVFKQLFEGGSAEIILNNPDNVLESGIDVTVRPPGKKPKSINLLSGGERSLTAIALLFSTYMVKPSPFCFLDEIDAALDEENVGRFIKMLKQFSEKTQFIVVSHNKKTMSVGSAIFGVTMEEPGVSKVVSVRFEKKNPVYVS